MNWEGKVVLVTGSSLGIGKAMAIQLGKKGGNVVINARHEDKLLEVASILKDNKSECITAIGDISVYEDCQRIIQTIIDKYNKIDVVINNAGLSADECDVVDISPESFKKVVDVNLTGSFFMTKAALPYIIASKGSIVFTGSVAGVHGIGGHAAYSASKMALTGFVESLRKEVSPKGVHIGIAYVGFTENDPNKTVYDKDGKVIPIPKRSVGKTDTPEKVAKGILQIVEKRKFKKVFTLLGKLNVLMNRFAPWLVQIVLQKAYLKKK